MPFNSQFAIRNPQLNRTSLLVLFFLLAATILFSACTLTGQRVGNYQITGRVIDPYGKPLEGAVVQFRWGESWEPVRARGISSAKVMSDEEGKFIYEESAAYRVDFWLLPPLGNLPRQAPASTVAFTVMREDYSLGWFILMDDELHKLLKVTGPQGRGEPDLYEGFSYEKSEPRAVRMEKQKDGRIYDLGDIKLEVAPLVM